MNSLLFVGREYFQKIAAAHVTREEKETYEEDLARYCQSKDGKELVRKLREAFMSLSSEEMKDIGPEIILWFLNWIQCAEPEWSSKSESRQDDSSTIGNKFLNRIWHEFSHPSLRARVLQMLLDLEDVSQCPVDSSHLYNFLKDVIVLDTESNVTEVTLDILTIDVIDTVLMDRRERPLKALSYVLESKYPIPDVFRDHIRRRAQELGGPDEDNILTTIHLG